MNLLCRRWLDEPGLRLPHTGGEYTGGELRTGQAENVRYRIREPGEESVGCFASVGPTGRWLCVFAEGRGAGTRDSSLTWQAFGGIGNVFHRIDLVAAYRNLEWDFDDSAVLDEVNFHGPFACIQLRF